MALNSESFENMVHPPIVKHGLHPSEFSKLSTPWPKNTYWIASHCKLSRSDHFHKEYWHSFSWMSVFTCQMSDNGIKMVEPAGKLMTSLKNELSTNKMIKWAKCSDAAPPSGQISKIGVRKHCEGNIGWILPCRWQFLQFTLE